MIIRNNSSRNAAGSPGTGGRNVTVQPEMPQQVLRVHYLKAPHLQSIHVDGAIGGPTAQGLLFMALFAERPPIPQVAEHELIAKGDNIYEMAPSPATSEGKDGIVREVNASFIMEAKTAIKISEWLRKHAENLLQGKAPDK
jgi:hypothetical protein